MRAVLPDPVTAPELFEGILTRRVLAFVLDTMVIGALLLLAGSVGLIVGFFTWGLGWAALTLVLPATIALYYAATLGSRRRATLGMRMMDLVLTPTQERRLDGPVAVVHAVLFWVSFWISWPISLAVALFTPRRQMLHDLLLGVMMVRRSPMHRHWTGVRAASAFAP